MVEITLNKITPIPIPIMPGICPNPKTTDETYQANNSPARKIIAT